MLLPKLRLYRCMPCNAPLLRNGLEMPVMLDITRKEIESRFIRWNYHLRVRFSAGYSLRHRFAIVGAVWKYDWSREWQCPFSWHERVNSSDLRSGLAVNERLSGAIPQFQCNIEIFPWPMHGAGLGGTPSGDRTLGEPNCDITPPP